MEQTSKASDSVLNRRLIGPIAIGFFLGFLLVGANRLQPEATDHIALHGSTVQPITNDPRLLAPGYAVSKGWPLFRHPLI